MSETYILLRQVQNALQKVSDETDNREHLALLSCADLVLNELMLRTGNAFYISYIETGRSLVAEGLKLADAVRSQASDKLPDLPDAAAGMDVISDVIESLNRVLVEIIADLDETRSPEHRNYADRVCAWEAELYSHSLQSAGERLAEEADPFTREAFEAYLRKRFPDWANLKITSFVPLTGGFSKRTVLFETEDDLNGQQRLILRAEQTVSLPRFSDVTEEFYLVRFAVDAGIPTPDVLWIESDSSHFGKPFVIMEVATGENYGWTMGQKVEMSDELLDSIIGALCTMHNARIEPGDKRLAESHLAQWMPYRTIAENARHYVAEYMPNLMRQNGIEPTPELARALHWLKDNVPDINDPPVLVHLDFGLNNMLIEGNRVSAILDWESARLGDPCDDIIVIHRELADHISMDEFLERYRAGTGRTISAYNMAYATIAAFAMYMIVYLNGRQKLLADSRTPISMSLLAFKYIAGTASQLSDLIARAESLR